MRTRFDYNPVNLRDPGTESVQAFNDLLARSHSSPWTLDVIAPDLDTAEQKADRLAQLGTVESAITLADYVPADQDEKLVLLEETSLFLPPLRAEGPPPDATAQRAALARLADELEPATGDAGSDPLGQSARRLREALQRFLSDEAAGSEARLALLASNVVGSLPEQLADLETALAAGPVGLDDLPRSLVEQMLAADGRARVQVYPREDLSDALALERFVDEVAALEPEATGAAAHLVGWGRVTVGALQQALASAVVIGSLFLLLLWRRGWDTFLAFLPLALAAAFTCAVMAVIDMPFNFANVIVLPMLLGMGIDSGIHLVHRHRVKPEEVDVLATSTARAVFFSALTTILSFASLAFVPHRGMAAIGKLLTLGVGLTLVCYVVVLPAVLEWDDRRRGRSRRTGPPPPAADEPR
jgi:hopanoid biosynthesis associated RND transporter like protein HpnN